MDLDDFSYHEAMDRASVACDQFYEYVAKHAVVQSNKELAKAAEQVIDVMYKFSCFCAHFCDATERARPESKED
jgi:hypothetical protein